MALYEVTDDGLSHIDVTGFSKLGLEERKDIQQLLRKEPSAFGEDLLIVAEEFGNWDDSQRRIDLLAVDRDARLVVIELKRTNDGGHMELQSIRYAAMVSSMTFDELVDTFAKYLSDTSDVDSDSLQARADLLEFFKVDEEEDGKPEISSEVRIILASAGFGSEITTTVLWLNESYKMDIRCIRLRPYKIHDTAFIDIQQIIPLREAADYQIKIRQKEIARERTSRTTNRDFTRYHIVVDGAELSGENKRNSIRVMVEELYKKGAPLDEICELFDQPKRAVRVVDGLYDTKDKLCAAALDADPKFAAKRWFCDFHLKDITANKTYVLTKQWGGDIEPILTRLSETFPDAKITFRSADA